jgi:hypothetical protein
MGPIVWWAAWIYVRRAMLAGLYDGQRQNNTRTASPIDFWLKVRTIHSLRKQRIGSAARGDGRVFVVRNHTMFSLISRSHFRIMC